MNPKEREAALETIRTSKTTRVILISFKAGSTGLNLTCCNNVILVDLWWNPALEVLFILELEVTKHLMCSLGPSL